MSEEHSEEREYTEAELTGEDSPGEAESTTGETATPPEPGPSTPEEQEKEIAEEKAEQEPASEPAKETPEKTVPLAALREERERRRELQKRLDNLEARMTEPKKDLNQLLEEDPEGAIRNLQEQITSLQSQMARDEMERAIKAEVPDFFDKAPQMEQLLLDQGMDEETVVNLIASTGKDAPKFFKLLSRMIDSPQESAVREQLTAELIPKITEQITKQLAEKFNVSPTALNIGKIPGTATKDRIPVETEEEFSKLSPEMQEKWLSGEI